MISPMTPPGTEVVCVNDSLDDFKVPGLNYNYKGHLDGLTKGQIYTVQEIIPTISRFSLSEYQVVVNEIFRDTLINRGFAIERFRYLNLAGLDELLKVKEEKKQQHEKV